MRVTMIDVARQRGTQIDRDWCKRAAAMITNEALAQIAGKYANQIAEVSREVVRAKAKVRTGALERAIGHHTYTNGQGSGAYLTWEIAALQGRTVGRINRAGQTYFDKNGVMKRYPRLRKGNTGFDYIDKGGHGRHVKTVADYARILEFSESRVLRHIAPAYNAEYRKLIEQMEKDVAALLDKAGL